MSRTMAIAGRELRSYLLAPGGYVIIALFLLITGFVFFFRVFGEGELTSLRSVFGIGTWLLAVVAPAITMRLISEEYRLGTFEALMTCPVREAEVVMGKFLGALALLVVMLAPTWVYVLGLELFGRPD
ncbi:MAG: ABC transporter permease subunit, partial [Planctomycetota bacterium]